MRKNFIRFIALIFFSTILGILLLTLAYGQYTDSIFLFYFGDLKIILLNIVPVILVNCLLLGFTGNYTFSYLIGSGILISFSLVNYFKIIFRDDCFIFIDLFLLKESKEMLSGGKYNLFINSKIIFIVTYWLISCIIIFHVSKKTYVILKKRLFILLTTIIISCTLYPLYINNDIYNNSRALEDADIYNATQEKISKGFIYPFIYSSQNSINQKPNGYNRRAAETILSNYTTFNIPEDKKVNIIAIMREAYVDFSKFNIEGLNIDAYNTYHELVNESYTGPLVTNIFAGGTILTEREFLTGNYSYTEYRSNSNSYVWYLRSQGYVTEGSHPYYQWFYNRYNINAYLGFEKYRFLENDYEKLSSSYFVADSVLLNEIYSDYLLNKKKELPYFSFNVNMQSHGPYSTVSDDNGSNHYLSGSYSDECKYAVNNYLNILSAQDYALKEMIEKLRVDSEPIVVIVFGDHMPWMGDGNEFYNEMNVNIDIGTEEGFYNYYSTEYLIWANDAAKQVCNNDFTGKGSAISPCYLMNQIFDLCGWTGPDYMQHMRSLQKIMPVINYNGYLVNDTLYKSIPESLYKQYEELEYVNYYWKNNFYNWREHSNESI